MWNHAYRLTASWSQAEDLTSTTFLLAWRKCGEVVLVRDSALPWLYTVAGNLARTEHRSMGRFRRALGRVPDDGVEADHADDVVSRIDDDRRMARVLAAVRTLPRAERQAVELCLLGDLPTADAAAAGVAVLAAGAVLVTQTAGPDGGRAATQPPSTSQPVPHPVPAPTMLATDDPRVTEALARCGAVVAASPRAFEYPPLESWEPTYGAEVNGVLVVPYREYGSKPGVCATTATTATVSDPSMGLMDLGQPDAVGQPPYSYYGLLYLPESGVLAGFAQSVESLKLTVTTQDGVTAPGAALGNELFVAAVGTLRNGDRLGTEIGFGGGTDEKALLVFDTKLVRTIGVSGTDR